jgi:hypothetical protein
VPPNPTPTKGPFDRQLTRLRHRRGARRAQRPRRLTPSQVVLITHNPERELAATEASASVAIATLNVQTLCGHGSRNSVDSIMIGVWPLIEARLGILRGDSVLRPRSEVVADCDCNQGPAGKRQRPGHLRKPTQQFERLAQSSSMTSASTRLPATCGGATGGSKPIVPQSEFGSPCIGRPRAERPARPLAT